MRLNYNQQDTICALSTAPGLGGIALVRLSGARSKEMALAVCTDIKSFKSHFQKLTKLYDTSGNVIDEALVCFFEDGKSFTGEQTIEFSCHGGYAVSTSLLKILVNLGARPAEKGEFTFRAFANGKLDLVQAESILQLIESKTPMAARLNSNNLTGSLSNKLSEIEKDLLLASAQLEARIDFSEEDIEPFSYSDIKNILHVSHKTIENLLLSFGAGQIVNKGLQVGIYGEPNVGKSSLLNSFINREKSIVTNIEGTTRDIVEGQFILEGLEVCLYDTAGIRKSDDPIESLGIKKGLDLIESLDLALVVIDAANPQLNINFLDNLSCPKVLIINKTDINFNKEKTEQLNKDKFVSCFYYSAKTKHGEKEIFNWLSDYALKLSSSLENEVITQARQNSLLMDVEKKVSKSLELLNESESEEFIAMNLQLALDSLFKISGKSFDEEVIDQIFGQFCLGK